MRTDPGFDKQSVLALVNQLHDANPAKMTFTPAEVAEALYGPGSGAFARGSVVMTSAGQPVKRHIMPAWMEVLNNILKKLGEGHKRDQAPHGGPHRGDLPRLQRDR